MLRITQIKSVQHAKTYYSHSDYVTEGEAVVGLLRGKGAARLGLPDIVTKEVWDALCENRDPTTGKPLTPRNRDDRRVGFDFTFSVPKGVSVLEALTLDERIRDAVMEAAEETMADVESEMKTRVRKGGRDHDRQTGNLIYGAFLHKTSRPVSGLPDPHTHVHAVVMNLTFDNQELRWKAGQFGDIKRDAPYFEALFDSRLARKLEEMGLPIERRGKGWDLADIPASVAQKFSRRTALIEEKAKELGISDPESKARLGETTREKKQKNLSEQELVRRWETMLTPDEDAALQFARKCIDGRSRPEDPAVCREAVDRAIEHQYERASVVPLRHLLADAMKRSIGKASAESVLAEVGRRNLIVGEREGRMLATTREVLAEETRMLDFARKGRGTCAPMGNANRPFKDQELKGEQQRAVMHVLTSPDRVILVSGAAGVGKTKMMTEAVTALEESGKSVFTFAPSAGASRGVLREEGFEEADTVATLLRNERLHDQLRGQVIWIDEAAMMGTRSMAKVFALAEKVQARVVLSGDTRQHGPVDRGHAMRLLRQEGGLVPAELRTIRRQQEKYKDAVQDFTDGRIADGFKRLDALGWLKEVNGDNRFKQIASDYMAARIAGEKAGDKPEKAALVVAPTHFEGAKVSSAIRAELKESGRLGKKERSFVKLTPLHLTVAERKDASSYLPGDVVVYHQNAPGHTRGERLTVGSDPIPLAHAERFTVFRPDRLEVASGELIRITYGGKSVEGKRLDNGSLYTVKAFDRQGRMVLSNGWTLEKDFGHIAHAYCSTTYAAQGKTVREVLVSASPESFPALSQEGFYVAISRGKRRVTVYSQDKKELLEAASKADQRISATEFVGRRRRERSKVMRREDRDYASDAGRHQDHKPRADRTGQVKEQEREHEY